MTEAVEAPTPQRECDLVMKGGITSGVVYPSAIRTIAARYRFRNLGGASAGAIAAVAAAACEFRRNNGVEDALRCPRCSRHRDIRGGLCSEPVSAAPEGATGVRGRTWHGDVVRIAAQPADEGGDLDLARAHASFLPQRLAVIAWAAIVVDRDLGARGGRAQARSRLVAIVLLVVVALPFAALLVGTIAARRARALRRRALNDALKANWFGMCAGRTEAGYPEQLRPHRLALQDDPAHVPGFPLEQPLTFAMLQGKDTKNPDVNLAARDHRPQRVEARDVPFSEPDEGATPYLFDPEESRRLFPARSGDPDDRGDAGGARKSAKAGGKERTLYPVPGLDLPIVVAARLSLSFPVLLSTVPLWRATIPSGVPCAHDVRRRHLQQLPDPLLRLALSLAADVRSRSPAVAQADLPPVEMSDNPRMPGFTKVPDVIEVLPAAPERRPQLARQHAGRAAGLPRPRVPDPPDGRRGRPEPEHAEEVVDGLIKRGEDAGELVIDPKRLRLEPPSRDAVLDHDADAPAEPRSARDRPSRGLHRRIPRSRRVQDRRRALASFTNRPRAAVARLVEDGTSSERRSLGLAEKWASEGEIDFDVDAPTPTPTLRILPRV